MKLVSTEYKGIVRKVQAGPVMNELKELVQNCKSTSPCKGKCVSGSGVVWLDLIFNIPSVLLLSNNFDFHLLQYFKYFCWFQKRKMSHSEVKPSKICSTFETNTLKHEKTLLFTN